MSVDAPVSEIPPGSGNDTLIDFSGMPALTVTGTSLVQVSREIFCIHFMEIGCFIVASFDGV